MAKSNEPRKLNALELLAQLCTDQRAVRLRKKATDAAIREMQAAAKRDLEEPIPDEYVAFLKLTNGVQINNVYFKEAENIVLENLDYDMSEAIVLGDNGNVNWLVFDKRDRRFHAINIGCPDEQFDSYNTFNEMLLAVMKEQDVLDVT